MSVKEELKRQARINQRSEMSESWGRKNDFSRSVSKRISFFFLFFYMLFCLFSRREAPLLVGKDGGVGGEGNRGIVLLLRRWIFPRNDPRCMQKSPRFSRSSVASTGGLFCFWVG